MSSLCSFESSFKDLSFKRARFRSLKKNYGNQKNLSWKTEIWLSRHERVKVLYVHFILMVWVWFPTTARQAICQQTSTPYPEELMRMLMIYRIQKRNSGHKLSRFAAFWANLAEKTFANRRKLSVSSEKTRFWNYVWFCEKKFRLFLFWNLPMHKISQIRVKNAKNAKISALKVLFFWLGLFWSIK